MQRLRELFMSVGVEYFGVLDYSCVIESRAHIRKNCGFEPKSAIVYLVPYFVDYPENISAYAASYDYHKILKEINSALIEELSRLYPNSHFCGFGDHSPIDERSAALALGLGVMGDNNLLLNEKYGSYVFIGDVITDVFADELGAIAPRPVSECLHCGACASACPTGILRQSSTECLSAITQKKGELTGTDVALMHKVGTVWGCDECQRFCPYNRGAVPTPISAFYEKRITNLTLSELDSMSDEEFKKRAFSWRGREVPRRNIIALSEYKKSTKCK